MMDQFDDEDIGELDYDDPAVRGARNLGQFSEVLDAFIDESKTQLSDCIRMDADIKKSVLAQLERGEVMPHTTPPPPPSPPIV
jgi:hypothetical protein